MTCVATFIARHISDPVCAKVRVNMLAYVDYASRGEAVYLGGGYWTVLAGGGGGLGTISGTGTGGCGVPDLQQTTEWVTQDQIG